MEFKIDKDKFDAMMSAVGEELEQMLSKSAVDDDPSEESSGDGPPAAPADDAGAGDDAGGSPAPEASAPEAAPAAESAPVSPEQSAAAASPDGSPTHEAGEIEPAPTVEALQAEYAKVGATDPEALKMHYLAAKAALVQIMGDQGGAAPMAPEASAAPAPAPMAPPAPAPGPEAFGKSEMWKAQQNEVKALKKAMADQRAEFEAMLSKANEESNKAVEQLADVLLMPIRKSVKGISDVKFIGKTGDEAGEKAPLTKAQVKAKLSTLIRSGSLSKSDKDKIAQYDLTHDISKIEHLLVEAAK